MNITRRDCLRLAGGAGATAVLSALDVFARSGQALAIAGVDDVALGGIVLVMLTLAGYGISSAVSDATLQTMGYSFSDFCQDAGHQSAAVTRAIADANNLGVEVNRMQAESAAAAIASGTAAFADWVSDAVSTGRATIDGWIGGVGANQAALWGLVTEWRSQVLGSLATLGSDARMASNNYRLYNYFGTVRLAEPEDFESVLGISLPNDASWVWCMRDQWDGRASGLGRPCYCGSSDNLPTITWYDQSRGQITFSARNYYQLRYDSGYYWYSLNVTSRMYNENSGYYVGYPIITSDIVSGSVLPGVDKAADCPATLGAGYDVTPIGADAVIGQDGDVVSSGTIALPVQLPGVDVPYTQGLYGLDAGVVPGLISTPYPAELTDVWVGTPTGVASMPITTAVAGSTSISQAVPEEPSLPNVPPGTPDVGPWTPAYELPFMDVWPFNMIYTFVENISALGGGQ